MRKLLQGVFEFRALRRSAYRETFARLALGQSPDALLIACSDSRVAPNVFASTQPGDIFVIRNVGNLVPAPDQPPGASEAAGLEFALRRLEVADIIVCGHSSCGAMQALLASASDLPRVSAWLRPAAPVLARFRAGARLPGEWSDADQLSQLNVLAQLEQIRAYPEASERLSAGRLRLHGWWFDLSGTELRDYDPTLGAFVPLDEPRVQAILARMDADSAPGASVPSCAAVGVRAEAAGLKHHQ